LESWILPQQVKITVIGIRRFSFLNRYFGFWFMLLIIFVVSACRQRQQEQGPKYSNSLKVKAIPAYHFAVHPLYNPAKMMESYEPLIDYLNNNIKGVRFILEASRDYGTFENKYQNRDPEFLLPNPWQTLQAMKAGYIVIAMAGEPHDFKGLVIVRKEGGIVKPSDLKGKSVSYPAPTALAACIMIQYFLHSHGINVNKDIRNFYVGSQESSIMNVYLKKTSAGACWPPPWRAFQKDHPREAAELKVIWETESLINNSVMIRNDLPVEIREKVQKCLINLQKSMQGKLILDGMETACFIHATNKDYNIVRDYIKRFEKHVRKISMK